MGNLIFRGPSNLPLIAFPNLEPRIRAAISYTSPSTVRAGLAALLCILLGTVVFSPQAAAQGRAWNTPFLPGGTLELSPGVQFSYWTTRFGYRFDEDLLIEEEEPWGFSITDAALASRLFPGELALRDALNGEEYRLTLGAQDALADAGVIRVPLGLSLGIKDWLTIGVRVPLVRRKIRLDQTQSADSATAGVTPTLTAPGDVSAFLSGFRAAVESATAQVAAICVTEGEGSTACQEGRAVVAEADALFLALSHTFTASPVFALEGSPAAAAVTGRVEEIRAALAALGGSFQAPLPLALAPMADIYRHDMLQEPVSGIAAYHGEGWYDIYELGDVELSADVRLLDLVRPGAEPGETKLRLLLGVGGTLRLGTGVADDQNDWLDFGSVTGQNDYEIRGFADLQAWGWVGISANYVYGVRGSAVGTAGWVTPLESTVAVPMAGAPLTWEPGGYRTLLVAPRVRIMTGLSLVGDLAYLSRDQDRWTTDVTELPILAGGEAFPIPDPSYLQLPSSESQTRVGVGLVYSTLPAVAAGEASLPMMIRARWNGAVAGSGGRVPRSSLISAEIRFFWSLWGGE